MKFFVYALLVSVLLVLVPSSVSADGVPPSQEPVCNILTDATPGLFGICNAYCEAKDCDSYPEDDQPRSCSRLLDNYNRIATDDDLSMPCVELEPEPMEECVCWDADDLDDVSIALANASISPVSCQIDADGMGGFDAVSYSNGAGSDVLFNLNNPGETYGCTYFFFVNGVFDGGFNEDISADEAAVCRTQIYALQMVDFETDQGESLCTVQ